MPIATSAAPSLAVASPPSVTPNGSMSASTVATNAAAGDRQLELRRGRRAVEVSNPPITATAIGARKELSP